MRFGSKGVLLGLLIIAGGALPAAACLDDLYERHPDLAGHPDLFGPAVRRMLGAAEAAILSAHLGPSRGIYGLS